MSEDTIRRIRLLIGYDGTDYSGWQRQNNAPSIQEEIERCLATMTQEDIFLHGAGRTDAGVHAMGMVAHFDTTSQITEADFLRGLNSMLPGAIRIFSSLTCQADFHARFCASGKRYHYNLFTGLIQPPDRRLYSLHLVKPLDLQAIDAALCHLIGEHDFSSFENTGSRDKTVTTGRGAVRKLFQASLLRKSETELVFEFVGDGFLKNMVRNLVGTLIEVGRGKISPLEFKEILHAKNRSAAGPTAAAHGLYLKEVLYK